MATARCCGLAASPGSAMIRPPGGPNVRPTTASNATEAPTAITAMIAQADNRKHVIIVAVGRPIRSASQAPKGTAGMITQLAVLTTALAVSVSEPAAFRKAGPNAGTMIKPIL